jgi:hypothetical protein
MTLRLGLVRDALIPCWINASSIKITSPEGGVNALGYSSIAFI